MKNIISIILFLCIQFAYNQKTRAQGCVAIRSMSCGVGGVNAGGVIQQSHSRWQFTTNYRHFRSFRHFRGDVEEHERIENKTEVINISHSVELGAVFQATKQLFISANVPLLYNDRSSLYEHYGNSLDANPSQSRFHTSSMGIGDARFSANIWLIDVDKHSKANVSLGAGVKLPTGNYKAVDEFHRLGAEKQDYTVLIPVDQSIQLGDGGFGYTFDVQGFAPLYPNGTLYFNGFYMFTPQNTNGVLRRPDRPASDPITASFTIADQYAGRIGINHQVNHRFGISLGGRLEGIPALDAIGKSEGFRRPGCIVSVEPGLVYFSNRFAATATVPVALYRNRVKSYSDLQDPTGKRHGDAAFADYVVNLSMSYFFGKRADKNIE